MAFASTYSQPFISRPRISKGRAWGSRSRASVSVGGDPQQQTSLAAGAHRHVAVDHEGETTEHSFLGEPLLALDVFANPLRKLLVIGHGRSVPQRARRAPGGASYVSGPSLAVTGRRRRRWGSRPSWTFPAAKYR